MRKLLPLFLILFQFCLWSSNQLQEIPAYWDGKHFHQGEESPPALKHLAVKEPTIYFAANHITCYGHALLDGVFPLYALLKKHQLLDAPLNLLIEATPETQANRTFRNILQLLKEAFHFKQVILINHTTVPLYIEKLILHDNIPFYGFQTPPFSFYRACPESFEYITALRELGFRENVVFQDTETGDNLVKEFVHFLLNAYHIDLPLVKNRVLLVFRPYSRRILNLKELSNALKRADYQLAVVDFEKLSVKQQIVETIQSEYLISTYGSNLVNGIFLKPQANVVILWHKYAKYFWSRRYCIIHSAFLATGARLIEYDKPDYDRRDVYSESIHAPDYFYQSNHMNILRAEKLNMDAIVKYPLPAMYEILNVDLYIDPKEVITLLKNIK